MPVKRNSKKASERGGCMKTCGNPNVNGMCAELVKNNVRLVQFLACKYRNKHVEMEDMVSIGMIGLIKAANSYQDGKGVAFGAYAATCIRNEMWMEMRKWQHKPEVLSLDMNISDDYDGDKTNSLMGLLASAAEDISKGLEDRSDKRELYCAIQKLSSDERKLVELRYIYGWTQSRVAKSMRCTQSCISRMEKRALKQLKELLNECI